MSDPVLIGLIAGILGGGAVIAYALMRKPLTCEKCGAMQPKFRKPANSQQAMWGGTTCPECNADLDRNGRVRK